MERQIYPLGQQSFKNIREEKKVYVDKTQFIPLLLENRFYFLSRPRRFGKSLFLSTLENFFLGRRNLFEGLAVDSYPWNWEEFPVIRINMGEGSYSKANGLSQHLYEIVEDAESLYDLPPKGSDPRSRLRNIIIKLNAQTGKEVVILIDEYEKPLLDAFDKPHYELYREELADFYSVLKANEERIRFLFITGVTRFGHLNIFSGFNNLNDISLDTRYSSICGITREERDRFLLPGIDNLASDNGWTREDTLQRLKEYFDGYHFSKSLIDIYNPYSLLSSLDKLQILPIWIGTGMSKSALNIIESRNWDLTGIENVKARSFDLLGIDSEFLEPTTLLYQSGYLTIKHYDPQTEIYTLGIPNTEVRQSLYEAIIPKYIGKNLKADSIHLHSLYELMNSGNAEGMMTWLQTFFSKIPPESKLRLREDKPQAEKDFQFVVYMLFSQVCSFNRLHLEYSSASGRSDIVIDTEKYVYIIELRPHLTRNVKIRVADVRQI